MIFRPWMFVWLARATMLPVAWIETSPDVEPVAATTCPSVTLPGLVTNTPAELAVALNEAPATSDR